MTHCAIINGGEMGSIVALMRVKLSFEYESQWVYARLISERPAMKVQGEVEFS